MSNKLDLEKIADNWLHDFVACFNGNSYVLDLQEEAELYCPDLNKYFLSYYNPPKNYSLTYTLADLTPEKTTFLEEQKKLIHNRMQILCHSNALHCQPNSSEKYLPFTNFTIRKIY